MQALTFSLKGEPFAVPIEPVKEIIEVPELTAVPLMPSVLSGVMNLRGAVIPVLDLAERFGLGVSQRERRTCVVVFETRSDDEGVQTLGALVDAVHEVIEVHATQMDDPVAFGSPIPAQFIRSMVRREGAIVVLLDIGRVLSLADIETLPVGRAH